MAMPAKIAQSAKSIGFCSCATSLVSFYKGVSYSFVEDEYNIEIDGKKVRDDVGEDKINTGLMVVSNGKFVNGGAMFNPFGCVNDGLVDITWVHDRSYSGYWGMSGLMKKAQSYGGSQVHDGHSTYMRGKSIRITQLSKHDGIGHQINIDNEQLHFNEFLKFECEDGLNQFNVDIFVDTDTYFTES